VGWQLRGRALAWQACLPARGIQGLPALYAYLSPASLAPANLATLPCRYHGKIAFGEALRSNAEVSGVFGVSEYPALLVVCGGNKDVVIKFEGGC
jgi:hypothetical protein